jgi:nicotinic acid mononucleotide adenylyltransferase
MDQNNITPSSHIKTLLEPNDISILPQTRLKVWQRNLIPAICFYNGSFAPIHAGHISVLREAKQYIDSLGTHELLATYISPSHSGYIAAKLSGEEFIGTGHRLAMIHRAVENLDWVMVDLYETLQPCKTSLSTIMEAFMMRVRSQLSDGAQMDIFWLKGEDALVYRPSEKLTRLGFQSVYVFNRGGSESVTDKNNKSISSQDPREKRWQQIRSSSSFPERYN